MKGFGKVLVGMSVVTSALLLYVHERVEMLRVSYRLYEKSSELSEKSEQFRRLKFEVAKLRSPQVLEKRLEELSLPLVLPKQIQVLRVSLPDRPPELKSLETPVTKNPSFDFLSQWIQIAQARTDQ
jgi:hypothetical protein